MGRLVLEGNPPVEVTLRRSARARRLSLRVSRMDGKVTLTLPMRVSEREGHAFARAREEWLRSHLEAVMPTRVPQFGGMLPFRGRSLRICPTDDRRISIEGEEIRVPGDAARLGARLQAYLKAQARDALAVASDAYAQSVARPYGRLTLRDTRSRWGSCSSKGDLMYSWRLIMAPPEVLEYVAAHEVAHLVHMDHSAAFWSVVAGLCPDYNKQRLWLRTDGISLHQLRFD